MREVEPETEVDGRAIGSTGGEGGVKNSKVMGNLNSPTQEDV